MVQLHSTTINLSPTVRDNVSTLLNQRVGLFTDLFVQTKLAHWNVRGPH
ncbi:MAG: DNA starvation/stationary phase protection protein Dps, partial [Sulfobacillus thermosulfidooxidans]